MMLMMMLTMVMVMIITMTTIEMMMTTTAMMMMMMMTTMTMMMMIVMIVRSRKRPLVSCGHEEEDLKCSIVRLFCILILITIVTSPNTNEFTCCRLDRHHHRHGHHHHRHHHRCNRRRRRHHHRHLHRCSRHPHRHRHHNFIVIVTNEVANKRNRRISNPLATLRHRPSPRCARVHLHVTVVCLSLVCVRLHSLSFVRVMFAFLPFFLPCFRGSNDDHLRRNCTQRSRDVWL